MKQPLPGFPRSSIGLRLAMAITFAACLWACPVKVDFGPVVADSPGAVTGIDHVLLTVSDLSRSIAFYRDVLGMHEQFRSFHFAMLRAGKSGVALSTQPWPFEKKGYRRELE